MADIQFSIDEEQLPKLNEWLEKHRMCGSKAAIGGGRTYLFCPTTLGVVIKVQCCCGKEIDLSNYENW